MCPPPLRVHVATGTPGLVGATIFTSTIISNMIIAKTKSIRVVTTISPAIICNTTRNIVVILIIVRILAIAAIISTVTVYVNITISRRPKQPTKSDGVPQTLHHSGRKVDLPTHLMQER